MSIMTPTLSEIVAKGEPAQTTKITTHRFTMTTDQIEELIVRNLNPSEGASVTFRWGSGQWPDLSVEIHSGE